MNVLVTGASGFIGSALCSRLASGNKVIGIDITGPTDGAFNITWNQADLTDSDSVSAIFKKHFPDVVIHCAGIAHQKIGAVDSATYMRVNSEATENLARTAAKCNPDVCFIFLSSVSVYGEGLQINSHRLRRLHRNYPQITPVRSSGPKGQAQISRIKRTKTNNDNAVDEDSDCWPSSDYAVSKLDAERRLIALSDRGAIHNLVILRLAPVYDRDWSFNLDRRVFAPPKLAYLRFGSGSQKMSALARPNLVDFIDFLIHRFRPGEIVSEFHRTGRFSKMDVDENNMCNRRNLRINVCDAKAYEFNTIIEVFKKSDIRPNRPVISVPLSVVWLATRVAGALFSNKKGWIHSCYDKLASDLVFDNEKMMGTGFRPRHSLETLFDPHIMQINAD